MCRQHSSIFNMLNIFKKRRFFENIFIFVPERSDCNFINLISDIELDLLIIDEIYKLKPKDKKELNSDDRIILMNKVYLNLLAIAKKIILLGPFIKQITFEQTKLDIVKYYTNLSPVFNYVKNCPDELKNISRISYIFTK